MSTISCIGTQQALAHPEAPPKATVASVTVSESNKQAVVPVLLSNTSNSTVEIQIETVSGTAQKGSDFTQTSVTVSIPSGSVRGTASIPILDDTALEDTENFTVRIVNVTDGKIGTETATVTITDDDNADAPRVAQSESASADNNTAAAIVTCGNPGATENDQGTFIWNDCNTNNWHVRVAAANTAQYYKWMNYKGFVSSDRGFNSINAVKIEPRYFDYVTKNGPNFANFQFNLSARTGIEGFDFTVNQQSDICFSVATSLAPSPLPVYVGRQRIRASGGSFNPATLGGCGGADNNQPQIYITDSQAREADRTATVNVSLSKASTERVSVQVYTVPGTAKGDGKDYNGFTRRVTFNPGQTTIPLAISLVDDGRGEATEKFSVKMNEPVGAALRNSVASVTVTDLAAVDPGTCGGGNLKALSDARLASRAPIKVQNLSFFCPTRSSVTNRGIRPENYGAVGNGSRDDTNAMIAAAKAATQSQTFLLLTRGKTYLVSRQIAFHKGARGIIGSGGQSTIKAARGMTQPVVLLQSVGRPAALSDFVVQDVTIDMNRSASSYAIFGQNPSKIGIYDSRLANLGPKNGGIYFRAYYGNGDMKDICIERNRVEGVTIDKHPRFGIFIDGQDPKPNISDIDYWKRHKNVEPTTAKAMRVKIRNNNISGGYYGIAVTNTSYSLIQNNFVTGSTRNIKLQHYPHHNIVDSNTCEDSLSTSILLGYRPEYNVITNNRCTSSRATSWGMIEMTMGAKGNIIANNTLKSPTSRPSHQYGIYLGVELNDNEVFGNTIDGHFSKSYIAVESSWSNHSNRYHRSNGAGWQNKNSNGQKIIANTINPVARVPMVFLGQTSQRLTNTDIQCNRTMSPNAILPPGTVPVFELETSSGGISGGNAGQPFMW